MVEEVVEDDMERVPEDPCLGQFMGRKNLTGILLMYFTWLLCFCWVK